MVQVVLSPIQETEGIQPGGTAALAQAVLSPTLTGAGLGPVAVKVLFFRDDVGDGPGFDLGLTLSDRFFFVCRWEERFC